MTKDKENRTWEKLWDVLNDDSDSSAPDSSSPDSTAPEGTTPDSDTSDGTGGTGGTGGCTCNNKCYGYTGCTQYGAANCTTLFACSCNGTCYGDGVACLCDVASYALSAPIIDDDPKQDIPVQIAGRIYTCGNESHDTEYRSLTEEFQTYEIPFTVNPVNGTAWQQSDFSAISAIGYVFGMSQGDLPTSNAWRLSAYVGNMYATIGWVPPRPVGGISLYKNWTTKLQAANRPLRLTGEVAHWSDNVAPSGTFTADHQSTNHEATKLNDSSYSTYWTCTQSGNHDINITCDFGGASGTSGTNPQTIARYDLIKDGTIYSRYSPKSWTLCGSNDSVTWTLLDTQTNNIFSAMPNSRKSIALSTPCSSFHYYKFTFTTFYNQYYYPRLAEIELFTWVGASGAETSQTVQLIGMHYLKPADVLTVVPTMTLVDDQLQPNRPARNYVAIARLNGQGML